MQLSKLFEANIHSLEMAETILLQLSDTQYRATPEPFTANMGKHLRHITDHYHILINGLTEGQIEYDQRARSTNEEHERSAMILRLRFISNQLHQLKDKGVEDKPLSISLSVDETDVADPVPSTLSRELVFLQSHNVHHFAIIAAILKLQGIQFDPDFGIAPSTLKYEHGKQCAP